MTDEQINLTIARVLGWHSIHTSTTGIKGMKGPLRGFMPLPNYCTDLNAMHEAEDELSGNQYMVYALMLDAVEGSLFGIRATARQRAEAFLRMLGKWATTEDSSVVGEEVQP